VISSNGSSFYNTKKKTFEKKKREMDENMKNA